MHSRSAIREGECILLPDPELFNPDKTACLQFPAIPGLITLNLQDSALFSCHAPAQAAGKGAPEDTPCSLCCPKGTERAPEQGRQCSWSLVGWTVLSSLRTELPASNSPRGTKCCGFYRICKGPSRLPWDTAWPIPSHCPEELGHHQNGVGEFVMFVILFFFFLRGSKPAFWLALNWETAKLLQLNFPAEPNMWHGKHQLEGESIMKW